MKKEKLAFILSIGALILAACSGSGSSTSGFRSGAASTRALTPESKLALGTLRLEGTPQAIDSASAAKLLPLWQLLAQLNSSNSTAPEEVAAVLDQIRSSMTPGQVAAIDGMQMTQADIFATLQGQGQQARTGETNASGTSRSSTPSAGGQRGGNGNFQFFGGGAPGSGGFAGGFRSGGSTGTGTAQTQSSATQRAQSAANGISGFLVNEVIRLLESKAAS